MRRPGGASFDGAALDRGPRDLPRHAWIPHAPEITAGPILVGVVQVRGWWLVARREWSQREGDRVLLAPIAGDRWGPAVGTWTVGPGETPLAVLAASDDGAPWLILQHPAPTPRILVERTDVRAVRFDGSQTIEGLATLAPNDVGRILHSDWRADPRPRGVVAWRGATHRPLTEAELADYLRREREAMDPVEPPVHIEREWVAIGTSGAREPIRLEPRFPNARVSLTADGARVVVIDGEGPTRTRLALDAHGRERERTVEAYEVVEAAFDLAPAPVPERHWNRTFATLAYCDGDAWMIVPHTLADHTVHLFVHRVRDGVPSAAVDLWSRPIPRQYDLPSAFLETRATCTGEGLVVAFRHSDATGAAVAIVRHAR